MIRVRRWHSGLWHMETRTGSPWRTSRSCPQLHAPSWFVIVLPFALKTASDDRDPALPALRQSSADLMLLREQFFGWPLPSVAIKRRRVCRRQVALRLHHRPAQFSYQGPRISAVGGVVRQARLADLVGTAASSHHDLKVERHRGPSQCRRALRRLDGIGILPQTP